MVSNGDVPSGKSPALRVQAAIVKGQIPGERRADEDPRLDPQHRAYDQIERIRLREFRIAVARSHELGLDLEDMARRDVQTDAPFHCVGDVAALRIGVLDVADRGV
jgi:hypothetical protein